MLTINEYEWFIIAHQMALSKFYCMKENSQKAKGNPLVVQAMEGFNFNVRVIFKIPTAYWLIVDGTDQ